MGDFDTSTTSSERGVTLVELLTVMAIISIVVGLPLVSMISQRKNATFEEGQATVVQALSMARSRAITGAGGTEVAHHIACVRENEVEIFAEEESNPIDCANDTGGTVYMLPLGVKAGTTSVSFSRILGTSTETEIVVSGFGNKSTTTVSEYGFIQ